MKIFILGKQGFIAKHIYNSLKINLKCLSISYSASTGSNDINIKDLPKFKRLISSEDWLIDCSWYNPFDFQNNWHLEISYPSKINEYKNFFEYGFKRIIHMGSCLEYGLQSGQLEDITKPQPITPYGEAKNLLREFIFQEALKYKVQVIWPRIFYLYGEGRKKNNLYNSILLSMKNRTNLETGSLDKIRDFIHVDYLTYIVKFLIRENQSVIFNLCSNNPISIFDFIKLISKNTISKQNIIINKKFDNDYEPNNFFGNSNFLKEKKLI